MKRNNNLKTILWVGGIICVALLGYWYYNQSTPGKLDTFAQCLSDKNLKFYGAFWCPHCQAQKALFGNSKSKLPYVECSTPDGGGQNQVCKDKKIESYPTWSYMGISTSTGSTTEIFTTGEKTLQDLSELSGCPLPADSK